SPYRPCCRHWTSSWPRTPVWCCRRRPVPARPLWCRWRCWTATGWQERRSFCRSRGGWRRGPQPNVWPSCSASRSVGPAAIASAWKREAAAPPCVVLQAPPGAGKAALVPLALLDSDWLAGKKIILLEPRRLAARAAAERLAQLLGEPVGQTVGYRIRLETRVSAATRIEVV